MIFKAIKKSLIFTFLIFSHIIFSQGVKVYDNNFEGTYNNIIEKLDKEINNEQNWTKKKIELICLKSDFYCKNWDYELANDILEKIPQKSITKFHCGGRVNLAKAIFLKYDNEPEKAEKLYKLAIEEFSKIKDTSAYLYANIELAEFYRKYSQYEIGFKVLAKVEPFLNKNKSKKLDPIKIKFFHRKAAYLNETAKLKESISFSRQSIELATEYSDLYVLAVSYNELGFSYKNLPDNRKQNLDSSVMFYKKSEQYFRQLGFDKEAIYVKQNWVTAYSHNDRDPVEVIMWFKEIEDEVKKKNLKYQLQDVYLNLHSKYKELGNYKTSLFYFQKYHTAVNDFINSEKTKEIAKINDQLKSFKLSTENLAIKKKVKSKQFEISVNKFWLKWYFYIIVLLFILLSSVFYLLLERRKTNKKLLVKNEEKDVLIQEIHHRVKNNLQYVRSLMELQLSIISKTDDRTNLEDVSRRIQAMTLVHEMLYTETESQGISIKEYLGQLIENLSIGYNATPVIKIHFDILDVESSIADATSLGIICAELFNNSVKHAFKDVMEPLFSIKLSKVSRNLELIVEDNGKASMSDSILIPNETERDSSIPYEKFDLNTTETEDEIRRKLGMRIIDIFARQIKGKYEVDNSNGFKFKLTFKPSIIY